jgi:60 kDa SS-A/Ro ribonucleoprotein
MSDSEPRAFQRWQNDANVGKLLAASIGSDPSLRDLLRLARPTPLTEARRAFFGWLAGSPVEKWAPATAEDLPEEVRALEAYRAAGTEAGQVEALGRSHFRWDLLADAAKGPTTWKAIARQLGAQALRMNLNTLRRHGVLDDPEMVAHVAARIADEGEIRRSQQFPYQYLAAYLNADAGVPQAIRAAPGRAAEVACGSVPGLPGPVVIGLDGSGSMQSAVTGRRGTGATGAVRCVDVAAPFAAAVLRRNPDSLLVPFDDRAHKAQVDPQDAILGLAGRLAQYGGGAPTVPCPCARPTRRIATAGSPAASWSATTRVGSARAGTARRP